MSIPISGKSLVELVEQLRLVEEERDKARLKADQNAGLLEIALTGLKESQAKIAEMRAFIDGVSGCCQHPTLSAEERVSRIRELGMKYFPAWPSIPDCGKCWFNVRELERPIELLKHECAKFNFPDEDRPLVLDALNQLKALKGEK